MITWMEIPNKPKTNIFLRTDVRQSPKRLNEGIKEEKSHCCLGGLVGPKPRQRQQRASVLPHTNMQAETASLLMLTRTLVKS